jgi:hypothetical protein
MVFVLGFALDEFAASKEHGWTSEWSRTRTHDFFGAWKHADVRHSLRSERESYLTPPGGICAL